MAVLKPMMDWADLPAEGAVVVREGYVVDFKEWASEAKAHEHAKDIAAFANAYGGTLIVGAKETTRGVQYSGLPADRAAEVAETYRLALRDRVRPQPRVDVVELRCPDSASVVVAVNVHPFVGQPVGAALEPRDSEAPGERGEKVGWRFPQRIANHTRYIQPQELAMMTDGRARRAAILLEAIPPAQRVVELQNWHVLQRELPTTNEVRVGDVNPQRNVVTIEFHEGQMTICLRIPLDDVESVWECREGSWRVRVRGCLQRVGPERRWTYTSYPR